MHLFIANTEIVIPDHVNEITLKKRIQYDVEYGDDLNEEIIAIKGNKKLTDEESEDQLSELYFDRVQKTLAFFSGIKLDVIQQMPIGELTVLYETHLKSLIELPNEQIDVQSFIIGKELFWLPDTDLLPTTDVTFNEFINAREITRNMNETSSQKLTSIAYLGAIFFRSKKTKFNEKDLDAETGRLNFMYELPLPMAMQVGMWYDHWSENIQKNFSIFEKAKIKGIDMSSHFDKWGWISFLNFVTKHGTIFYKSNNLSNLENIKAANLYEVLIWASCEKDQEDIIAQYYDALEKKMKNKSK